MLAELTIKNFAIIADLHLQFGSGFNVLTGETGAGKSIILDAIGLILGGRADSSFIRAGRDRTYVEAIFELSKDLEELQQFLSGQELLDPDDPHQLILARELRDSGRNICRINGITVRVGQLREIGEYLVGIHGQGDHLRLLNPKSHLPLLDAYAGLTEEQLLFAEKVKALRKLEKEFTILRQNESTRQQRVDYLKFQIEEIDEAQLTVGEEEEVRTERSRLGNMQQLIEAVANALSSLSGLEEDDTPGATDLASQAEAALSTVARLDPEQAETLAQLQGVVSELGDVAMNLRLYQDGLEHDPGRLNFLEERLDLINRLKRKYGGTVEEILSMRDEAFVELDLLENSDQRLAELNTQIDGELKRLGQLAAALSTKRQSAAQKLASNVEAELKDLRMEATFSVQFRTQEAADGVYVGEHRLGFDQMGIDLVEFLLSANPGEPPKPMAKVASGGETARIMLSLKTALARVDETPTLIFDEIDQGIGGRIGSVVGQKLWELAGKAGHQVLVVTHLPQMAGFGDIHFHVQKEVANAKTTTLVTRLDHQARVAELGAMLGTKEDLAKVGARSLLKEAQQVKQTN
ncbi:MAG: DNA repair protein RecN [Ardenticatenaceae bacterium]|nr:DNA repair protein RecN [Ardenticatenaceae bacterium]